MKLLRFGPVGYEKPGILDQEGNIRDISSVFEDYKKSHFANETLDFLAGLSLSRFNKISPDTRISSFIGSPGKLVCIGLNYTDHAHESNMAIPSEPIVFMKATSSICGPNDAITLPFDSQKADWEVELGIVIGGYASNITENDAMSVVAGYCIVNDISERSYQLERGGQWCKGKSHDTFAPLGPYMATPDEIQDINNLNLTLEVNGIRYQDGNTKNMIFKVPYIISYISKFMTLEPGDIIATGTPAGVGMGQKPQIFLKAGDIIKTSIDFLGEQTQLITQLNPVSK